MSGQSIFTQPGQATRQSDLSFRLADGQIVYLGRNQPNTAAPAATSTSSGSPVPTPEIPGLPKLPTKADLAAAARVQALRSLRQRGRLFTFTRSSGKPGDPALAVTPTILGKL